MTVTAPPCLPWGIFWPALDLTVPPLSLLLLPQAATNRARAISAASMATRFGVRVMRGPPCCGTYGCTASSSAGPSLLRPRVEGVLQTVADQVERQDGQQEGEARESHEPPGGVEDAGGVGDHRPPARGGWLDADAQERQRCLEQDVRRDQQRRVDDDRRDQVGKDVLEQDARVGGAEREGGLDVLLLADRQDLAADDARHVGPAGERDHE